MPDVIGIGSTFIDYFFEADDKFLKKYGLQPEDDIFFGEKKGLTLQKLLKDLPLLTKSPGGMSTNTSAILGALGVKSAYYGVVGKDAGGKFWKSKFSNLDTSRVISEGKTSICACVLNNRRRDRLFISQMNAFDNVIFKKLDYEFLNKAKFIHISPFLLNHEGSLGTLGKILDKIDNPMISFTPSLINTALGLKKLLPVIKKVDILFLNKNELKLLTKKEPRTVSKQLAKSGPDIVVCTLGDKGVLITTKEKQFFSKAQKVQKIVDSTGAGDAFAAGFLFGVFKNKNLKWSAELGNKIAALALSDYGLSWLTHADVQSLITST